MTDNEWLPITEYNGGKVERWHTIHNCIVTVRLLSEEEQKSLNSTKTPWVDGTYSNTWPEESFLPFFRDVSKPPSLTK